MDQDRRSDARTEGGGGDEDGHGPVEAVGEGLAGEGPCRRPIAAAPAASIRRSVQRLASPARIRVLARLPEAPCPVGEPAGALRLGRPTVSDRLRPLRRLDLVAGRRDGRSVVYELRDEHVTALLRQVPEPVHHGRRAWLTAPRR
ncbi:ArsR/SmtB family transcription factor [Streptomyces sp. NPDC001389]|uniref:ArsR/SmtB family transcription factor n=1 Tax=Streptomyces sp. NPDC001389 TaxID=3364569 RepID=UPI00367901DC